MTGASSSSNGTPGLVPAPASGDEIKFLRGDGSWVVPNNNDYQVQQTNTTSDAEYRVLLSYSATNSEETNIAYKSSGLLFNPNSNTLKVTYVDGTAATASRASADALGNVINTTYLTKADGLTAVTWDKTNHKLIKVINGNTTDVLNFIAGNNISFTTDNDEITITADNDNTTYGLSGNLLGNTFVTTLVEGGTSV